MISLEGRKTLITGGSRGIGRAICLALAEAGARVAVHCAARTDLAEGVVAAIREVGGEAEAFPADLAAAAEWRGAHRGVPCHLRLAARRFRREQ